MILDIKRNVPESYEALRQAIYEGVVFLIQASRASLGMIESIKAELLKAFPGVTDLQRIHSEWPPEAIDRGMSQVRAVLANPDVAKSHIFEVTSPFNLSRENMAFDVLRPRWNQHEDGMITQGVHNAIHRDTWYANPQCQLNWWIPLFDVTQEQSFTFFPSYFKQPIPNTSSHFDYASWSQEVGFQTHKTVDPKRYPTSPIKPLDPHARGIACQAGDILIFSGAHLHQTAPNRSGLTRFSVDFRTVHLPDHQQCLGAPNVDNASKGDASVDYLAWR